jgi:hypothetical protein
MVDKLNIQGISIQKFWTRHEEQTIWTYRVIPSKSFQPDMKYWRFKKFGLSHPVCLICQCFMSGLKFWMESSCKFNLSILHVWFKTFDWTTLIWSLWPNIRFLPSIVAEKNVHICSMCIKTN